VGINMNAHIQRFKDYTTIEMVNCLDLRNKLRKTLRQSITNSKPRLIPSDELSDLVVADYNTPLPALDRPQDITELRLVVHRTLSVSFSQVHC
jgi:hypothetical protein